MTPADVEAIKTVILSRDASRLQELSKLLAGDPKPYDTIALLDFQDDQLDLLIRDPKWMEFVYAYLSQACGVSADPLDEWDDDTHLLDLGRTFVQLLLPGLRRELATFADLDRLPPLEPELRVELEYERDVVGAKADGIGPRLAWHGLRPVAFHLAMNGIATLVDDLREDGDLTAEGTVRLYARDQQGSPSEGIDFREAAMEIALSASLDLPKSADEERRFAHRDEIPLVRSEWILDWLMQASLSKPLLFPGYFAAPEGEGLKLTPKSKKLSRETRWTYTRESPPSPLPGAVAKDWCYSI